MQCVQEVEDNAIHCRETGIIPAPITASTNLTLCSHQP